MLVFDSLGSEVVVHIPENVITLRVVRSRSWRSCTGTRNYMTSVTLDAMSNYCTPCTPCSVYSVLNSTQSLNYQTGQLEIGWKYVVGPVWRSDD